MKIGSLIKLSATILSLAAIVIPVAIKACDTFSHNDVSSKIPGQYKNLLKVVDSLNQMTEEIDYEGFKVGFNADNSTPRWVAWELLASETSGKETRRSQFWHDDSIEGSAFSEDYRNSGYDRGHMCPAADQKWSQKAMDDCFVMTNIAPQNHALNSGAWQTLEKKERLWANRDSCLIIVAGPIYKDTDRERIGKTGVRVPSAFFKIIAAPYISEPRGIGFVYPNMTSPGNMKNYSMTIREVEKLTGLDFLSSLPDELEAEIETKTSFSEWNN